MKFLPLSLLSRLSAGALLSQSMVPAVLPLREKYDADKSREAARSAALAKAALPPPPMKGVPLMKVGRAVAPTSHAFITMAPLGPGRTLLDPEAYLRQDVSDATLAAWRAEALTTGSKARKARLLVQLGEVDLARHEPADAQGRFDRAAALTPAESPDRGLARFDASLALFFQGRFAQANLAFRHVAAAPIAGVPRKLATLYARHAAACEGYHAERAAMDIPEPPFLDPLCGVASLAVCLRGRGMPYAKADVLGKVYHDGEGSDLDQLRQGAQRLGLVACEVSADERGLRALPKPLVAHVEHDHFVAVVAADKGGVEYVCSDCGAWPGGPVRLTWTQWRMVEADRYLAVAKPGSPEALALASLPTRPGAAGHLAFASTSPQNPGLALAAERVLAAIGMSVLGQTNGTPPSSSVCGMRGTSPQCTGVTPTPTHGCGPGGIFGTGDPVNLATGEEEYAAPEGLRVYNPTGPSVDWRPSYHSLANTTPNGFGSGWTHPYNWRIEGPQAANQYSSGYGNLVLPNSGRVQFHIDPTTPPTSGSPIRPVTVQAGYPYRMAWCYDGSHPKIGYYVVTTQDRTQMTFKYLAALGAGLLYPTTLVDRVGNSIALNWSVHTFGTFDVDTGGYQAMGLDSIADSAGSALLTLGYSNGRAVSASDRYGRSVYYTVAGFANTGVPSDYPQSSDELTQVSQIVATGTSSPPVRFQYGYQNQGNGEQGETVPYLHTIAVPSPTGSGMSSATIDYSSIGEVTDTVDANGNQTVYSAATVNGSPQANSGRVQVKDPQGNLVYQVDEYFNSNMSGTKEVNGAGQTVWTRSYGDSNTPYAVSGVTDGNGRTWNATYDQFGHLLTSTTPKGTKTTNAYGYGNFALGELTSTQQGSKTATSYSYYEPSGLVQEIDAPVPGQSGSGSTQAQTYTYDALGNVTQVVSPGNNATSTRSESFGYTTDGSYTQQEFLGKPIIITDSLGKVTHLRYDLRGNMTSVQDPVGLVTQAVYNLADQETTVALPATGNTGSGNSIGTKTYLYGGGPLVTESQQNESGVTVRTASTTYGAEGETLSRSGSTETVAFSYFANYRKKSVTDGSGHATTYAYDLNGYLTKTAYPSASGSTTDQTVHTSYDPVGNLTSRTDGNGQVKNYAYGDGDGKLSSVTYPSATSNNVTLTYDAYGRLVSSTDATGSSSVAYDDEDRVVTSTRAYSGLPAATCAYTYWPDASRHTFVNPAGAWTYTYDADGRYTSLSSPAGTSSAAYLDNGWQASRTLPNGSSTSYSYNGVGELTGLVNQTAGGGILSQYGNLAYNDVLNPASETANVPGAASQSGTTTFAYDSKDRLTQESSGRSGGYSESFAYDASGNPTTFKGASQSFDADNRQVSGGTFVYDGNGNPTTFAGTTIAFSPEGGATAIGSTFSAGYRADGLRGWKGVSGTRTYYLYDDGKPVVELDASGAVQAINVYAPDGLVAREQSGSWLQYAFDPQGNVAQRLSSSGSLLSSSIYDAYGTESTTGAVPSDPAGYDARFGYQLDRETGLYLCQNRYYSPATGRWLTRDPSGYDGGINLYAYCQQSPHGSYDATGEFPAAAVPGGIIIGGGAAEGGGVVGGILSGPPGWLILGGICIVGLIVLTVIDRPPTPPSTGTGYGGNPPFDFWTCVELCANVRCKPLLMNPVNYAACRYWCCVTCGGSVQGHPGPLPDPEPLPPGDGGWGPDGPPGSQPQPGGPIV